MGVVVTKSSLVVIRPPEPVTTTESIVLSSYDKFVLSLPVTMFLVFDRPIHEPAETIKSALSKALVHYLPISGRLAVIPGQDDLHIAPTGEGIPFVAAAASCALKDVKFFDRTQLVDELAVYYPATLCGRSDPLLMMQVTEFSCGGFVIGVTWNHVIADAAGIGQFLQALGELAHGLSSPSVVPVRRDDLLTGVSPPSDSFTKLMLSLQPVDMPNLDITVPSRIISGIKEEYRVHSGGCPCTTFEAVTALLWQCRTRAIALSNPEEPVAVYFAVNARKYVGAKAGYYGNCIIGQLVMATAGAVANGDLMDVVDRIRRAKSKIAGQFNNNGARCSDDLGCLVGYNLFLVSCWRNLGIEGVDFGGGRPVRVMTRYAPQRPSVPACVVCLPCQAIDGSNVMSSCVREEHAGVFLGELSSKFQ